jgi:hypothetical protein
MRGRVGSVPTKVGSTSVGVSTHVEALQLVRMVRYLINSDRDCRFGPVTEAATKDRQEDHALVTDGIVGPLTFGKADDYLYRDGDQVTYDGSVRDIGKMRRDSRGRYHDIVVRRRRPCLVHVR